MKEVWKDVVGYEGLYEVSNLGEVRSLLHGEPRLLKPAANIYRNGYMQVVLRKDGKSRVHRIHRLVAIAFIPNPDNLPEVNHKDENTANNNVDNLEWCTKLYNLNYSNIPQRGKEYVIAAAMNMRTPVVKYDRRGNLLGIYNGIREAGRETGIDSKSISACCNGKATYTKQYIWRFLGDDFYKYPIISADEQAVAQYTKDGIFLKVWLSLHEIRRELGYDDSAISRCCRGMQRTSYGYVWKFINSKSELQKMMSLP